MGESGGPAQCAACHGESRACHGEQPCSLAGSRTSRSSTRADPATDNHHRVGRQRPDLLNGPMSTAEQAGSAEVPQAGARGANGNRHALTFPKRKISDIFSTDYTDSHRLSLLRVTMCRPSMTGRSSNNVTHDISIQYRGVVGSANIPVCGSPKHPVWASIRDHLTHCRIRQIARILFREYGTSTRSLAVYNSFGYKYCTPSGVRNRKMIGAFGIQPVHSCPEEDTPYFHP